MGGRMHRVPWWREVEVWMADLEILHGIALVPWALGGGMDNGI